MVSLKFIVFSTLALGGLGWLFGLILGYASKKFAVEVDPRVEAIRDALPGANCGGCGYAGCDSYAEAIVSGEAAPNLCVAGGTAVTETIASVMGVEVTSSERMVAFVKCGGTPSQASWKFDYLGSQDCRKAVVTPGGGPKACDYGCMGFGTCVDVCQFDAICIFNGIARVDWNNCVGCGACVDICPKNVIELRPISKKIEINCNSHGKGADVKKVCKVGCIGCGLCAKFCPKEAIEMVDNLPVIDASKCVSCGICIKKCPTGAIKAIR